MPSPKENTIISIEEMTAALKKSGYLMEQRVENVFKKNKFITSANSIYVDSETNITKEIDVIAHSFIKPSKSETVTMDIICECENNLQPVVFFESEYEYIDYINELKSLYFPKFLNSIFFSIAQGKKQKPLYDGVYSTQYCSFHKPKNKECSWLAHHPDDQHKTFEGFIKYFQSLQKRSEKYYLESFTNERLEMLLKVPCVSGTFSFFLLVLQGDIYSAKVKGDDLKLEKASHIKFVKNVPGKRFVETFFIDVIQENYLEQYLKYFQLESAYILKQIKKNREKILEEKKREFTATEKSLEDFKNSYLKKI
jgi:hypothetical protein